MKLNLDLETMKLLAARLRDEQPGSVLADVRRQLDDYLKPKPRQQLTTLELEAVVDILGRVDRTDHFVLPKATSDRLQSARVKLHGMFRRQAVREQDHGQNGRGQ